MEIKPVLEAVTYLYRIAGEPALMPEAEVSGVRTRHEPDLEWGGEAPEGIERATVWLEQALSIYKGMSQDSQEVHGLVQKAHQLLMQKYGPDSFPLLKKIWRHDALGGYTVENTLALMQALRVLRKHR